MRVQRLVTGADAARWKQQLADGGKEEPPQEDNYRKVLEKTIPAEVTAVFGTFIGIDFLPQWNWALVLLGAISAAGFAFFLYADKMPPKGERAHMCLHVVLAATSFVVLMISLLGDQLDVFPDGSAPSDFVSRGETRVLLLALYAGVFVPLALKLVHFLNKEEQGLVVDPR